MSFRPVYALHKDGDGKILSATATNYNFELDKWLHSLSVRPGDTIEFGEKVERRDPEVPLAIVKDGATA